MKTSTKLFWVALSWTAVPAFGHDHDQMSDQPDALPMFALLMLSVLISTCCRKLSAIKKSQSCTRSDFSE
ncbi:MAG: hypothetical protein CME47_06850 [Halieaceae bacterium]|nr:hypothetical protein [Halieaceae bacterium]